MARVPAAPAAAIRHVCGALASLGVRLAEADVLAAARADPRAEPALLRALHDLALLHSAGWPPQVSSADVERAWLAAGSPEDALVFVQAHLHACGYMRAHIYYEGCAVPGSAQASGDAVEPVNSALPAATDRGGGFSRELLLALGWLAARSGALQIAASRQLAAAAPGPQQPLWPSDTCGAAHNVARAAAAGSEARACVGRLRRASLGLLARAAGRPGPPDEPVPSLAEAIVASGHCLLSLLGKFALTSRHVLRAQLRFSRLFDRAQRVGRALRLPAFVQPQHAAAAAGARGGATVHTSWTLFELWVSTLGGSDGGAGVGGGGGALGADAGGAGAGGGGGGGGGVGRVHAGSGAASDAAGRARTERERRAKQELRFALVRLRAGTEGRHFETAFYAFLRGAVLGGARAAEAGGEAGAPRAAQAAGALDGAGRARAASRGGLGQRQQQAQQQQAQQQQPQQQQEGEEPRMGAPGAEIASAQAQRPSAREQSERLGAHLQAAARALAPHARNAVTSRGQADVTVVTAKMAAVHASVGAAVAQARARARASADGWPAAEPSIAAAVAAAGAQSAGSGGDSQAQMRQVRMGGQAVLPSTLVLAAADRPGAGPSALPLLASTLSLTSTDEPARAAAIVNISEQTAAIERYVEDTEETLAGERLRWREELRQVLEPLAAQLVCWGF